MNRLTHPLRLLIVFVSFLLACSCTQPDSSHASVGVVPQSSNSANSRISTTGPETTPNVSKAEAYLSGEVAIITIDQTEKNSRFSYDLDVHYPQIANPSTRNHRRFNSHVRSWLRMTSDFSDRIARRTTSITTENVGRWSITLD